MIRTWLGAVALMLGAASAGAERDEANVYVFGNSLVHFLSERSELTNVPHWLDRMAEADGRRLGLDGQWGFLRNFADGLPPDANWSFPGVDGVWSPGRMAFGAAGFDAVLLTPANFIQYRAPDLPYEGDNSTGESPQGAALRVLDWVHRESPATRLFLYEGWAELDARIQSFPPGPEAFASYHAFNRAQYHDWYDTLLEGIRAARPDLPVTLIPVASELAELFAPGGLLDGLSPEDLYEDGAPHGTPTLYMLAAMVVYPYLFDAPPPAGFRPPANLHPEVVAQYDAIAAAIWDAVPKDTRAEAPAPAPVPVPQQAAAPADLPERQPVVLPPTGLRPEGLPALGMGLNGLSDWSTQHPFLDLMKSARPWVGHVGERWGAVSTEALRAGGHLDAQGWPVSLPENVDTLETVLLTDQPEGAEHLSGTYVVTWQGKGKLSVTGRARRVWPEEGRLTFRYMPGEGVVGLQITRTDPDDPIRDITIVHEDHLALHAAGALFNPDWLAQVQDLRAVRFMDWMMTNGSLIRAWDDRPRMEDAMWTEWGVPLPVMLRLANRIGADPWFTLPHMADDDYVRAFAEEVKGGLDPRLKAYVEYSNEVWNQIFPQAIWARDQAEALWGESQTGWAQYYGLRAAQVMAIFADVFGEAAEDRLIRVAATHTGWLGIEEQILIAPLALLKLGYAPKENFDAYAVTGYFGYEMGGEEMADRMRTWLDASEDLARGAGEAQGLRRVALREFVKAARFDAAIAPVAIALQEGSLRELVEEVFPYHAAAARDAGLQLVMYEGGTHVSAHGTQVNDERLTDFFEVFNYTPEMAKLYEALLAGWTGAGGTLFNAFVDVAPATRWGSWGALRHLEDDNPRWDMLMAFNASGPNGWEVRDLAAFANGITEVGGSGADRLEGTAAVDVLLGGGGDDRLTSNGGGDVLDGGPGRDVAILPGAAEDYTFRREGGRLLARGPRGDVTLTAVEILRFDAGPDTDVETEGL